MSETKIKAMGATPHAEGVAFRVWAPHAERVSVIGSFNGWDSDKHPMQAERTATGTLMWLRLMSAISTSSC